MKSINSVEGVHECAALLDVTPPVVLAESMSNPINSEVIHSWN